MRKKYTELFKTNLKHVSFNVDLRFFFDFEGGYNNNMNNMNNMNKNYYIGIMSGTSMDAVDAALLSFEPLVLHDTCSINIPELLKKRLLNICLNDYQTNTIRELGQLDVELGRLFAQSVFELLKKSQLKKTDIVAIGCHGQTIYHEPEGPVPFTLQIGDPNTIAAFTNITTVADFRRRDIALGGQAAPLAPLFHHYLAGSKPGCFINIGGIANVTFLPNTSLKQKKIIAFDTGPGNTLLDAWCMRHQQKPFDESGNWAASGTVNQNLLNSLLQDPYFSKLPPKSTGREYFNEYWLNKYLQGQSLDAKDIQATLLILTAESIAQAIKQFSSPDLPIWLCGGGIHNHHLIKHIQEILNTSTVSSTETLGIHPDWIEAACFAWLAKETLLGKQLDLPSITGAKQSSILGGIYMRCH